MLSLSSVSSDSIKVRMPLHALGIEVPAHIKQSSTSAGNFCAFVARRASKTPCRASKTPDMASKTTGRAFTTHDKPPKTRGRASKTPGRDYKYPSAAQIPHLLLTETQKKKPQGIPQGFPTALFLARFLISTIGVPTIPSRGGGPDHTLERGVGGGVGWIFDLALSVPNRCAQCAYRGPCFSCCSENFHIGPQTPQLKINPTPERGVSTIPSRGGSRG